VRAERERVSRLTPFYPMSPAMARARRHAGGISPVAAKSSWKSTAHASAGRFPDRGSPKPPPPPGPGVWLRPTGSRLASCAGDARDRADLGTKFGTGTDAHEGMRYLMESEWRASRPTYSCAIKNSP